MQTVGEKKAQARGITVLQHRDGNNLVHLKNIRSQRDSMASDK